MELDNLTEIVTNRFVYKKTITGNSKAIALHKDKNNVTVLFSSVSGGTASLEYSLNSSIDVANDSAIWHVSTLDSISANTGIPLQSPAAFVRVVATNSVTYTLEIQA